ncbi:MAG TPA: hypothetical protein VIM86_09935 [Thermodesulfobacteriota bacterium]
MRRSACVVTALFAVLLVACGGGGGGGPVVPGTPTSLSGTWVTSGDDVAGTPVDCIATGGAASPPGGIVSLAAVCLASPGVTVEQTGTSLTIPSQPLSCNLGASPLGGMVSGVGTVSGDGQVDVTLLYAISTPGGIVPLAERYSGTAAGLTLPLAWLRAWGTELSGDQLDCTLDTPTVTFTVTP